MTAARDAIEEVADVDAKMLATLRARAALAGFEVTRLADGTFYISRWCAFRELESITAVDLFLRRVEDAR